VASREHLKTAVRRHFRAGVLFVAHLLLAAVALIGIWLLEKMFQGLWGEHEPTFFGWLPVKWLFDGADVGVILVVGVRGILEINHMLKR
jgi:hypothetical protein